MSWNCATPHIKPRDKMHLRPMTRSDHPSCASIGARAFLDDELFTYLAPHRHEHPRDFRNYILRRLKMRYTEQGMHGFVCVSDNLDGRTRRDEASESSIPQKEVVMGYAFWNRIGTANDRIAAKWQRHNSSPIAKLEEMLLAAEDRYAQIFGLDRSHSPARIATFRNAVASERPFVRIPAYWHLQTLAVSPDYQRRGVGRCLLEWGLEMAREEGVSVTVESSDVGRQLYAKNGFKVVDWLGLGVEEGWLSGAAMICDVERRWTREVVEGEVAVKGGREVEVTWAERLQSEDQEQRGEPSI